MKNPRSGGSSAEECGLDGAAGRETENIAMLVICFWWLHKHSHFSYSRENKSTRLWGTGKGGGGRRAGGALGGRVAASLSPQVWPDSQPLGHLDMVRRVDVVKHAASCQLHLKRSPYTDQNQPLRAQINTREQVQYTQKNQWTLWQENESTALGYNSTRNDEGVSPPPPHRNTHVHTVQSHENMPLQWNTNKTRGDKNQLFLLIKNRWTPTISKGHITILLVLRVSSSCSCMT